MLNYNHLYYFHIAASEGSLAAAAERLGVTQPTVSEQIRSLERTLKVGLFDRTPSGLRLTEAGRLAYEHTSVMFRAGERLMEALGHNDRDVPRTLRVGLSSAVARATTTDFLLPLLAIERCMPSIRTGDSLELVRDLRAGELDLVLSEGEPPEAARQGLEVVLLERTSLVAIAPPDLGLEPSWQNAGLIHYRPSSSFRWDVEAYLDANQLRPAVTGEADDALFLIEASVRGGYIAFVPRSVARDAIATGRVRVLAAMDAAHAGVHALYADSSSSDLARRAVEVLIAYVQATPHAT